MATATCKLMYNITIHMTGYGVRILLTILFLIMHSDSLHSEKLKDCNIFNSIYIGKLFRSVQHRGA